jgi:hypothetical protein
VARESHQLIYFVQETETKNPSCILLPFSQTLLKLHASHNLQMNLSILFTLALAALAVAGPVVKVNMNSVRQVS